MIIKIYERRPTQVRAIQWNGPGDHPSVISYDEAKGKGLAPLYPGGGAGYVETFDGVREVFPGDYLLIGRYGVGDLWPMRKGDFERDFKCIDTAG